MKSYVIYAFCIVLSSVSGLNQSMTNTNGQPDIASVLSHVTSMEQTIANLQLQMTTTNTEQQSARTELAYMKSSQKSTEAELASVKAQLVSSESELSSVKAQLETTKTDLATTKTDLATTKTKLVSGISTINSSVNILRTESGKRVAFEALQLVSNDDLGPHEPLRFDHVALNIGNAYTQTSGIFVVPYSGTYFLWANVLSDWSPQHLYMYLVKNGNVIFQAYTGSSDFGTASINHVVSLKEGDHVYITIFPLPSSEKTTIHGDKYSNYGGILLHT